MKVKMHTCRIQHCSNLFEFLSENIHSRVHHKVKQNPKISFGKYNHQEIPMEESLISVPVNGTQTFSERVKQDSWDKISGQYMLFIFKKINRGKNT